MGKFETIKIIHDIKSREAFTFYSEFFRIYGIYVGEYIALPEDEMDEELDVRLDDQKFDIELYLGETKENTPSSIRSADMIEDSFCDQSLQSQQDEKQKELLIEVVKKISEAFPEWEIPLDEFETLAKIYVENNLMLHSANLQYFRFENEIHDDIIKSFEQAVKQLDEESKENKPHLQYAMLYCKCKVNTACFYKNYGFRYDIVKLGEECKKTLIDRYNNFSNAYVLLGLIYKHSAEYAREAVAAFQKALEIEGDCSYMYHVYYWMAKRYEVYKINFPDAERLYQQSYQCRPRYRNVYKLAIMDYNKGLYIEAMNKFKIVLKYLNKKWDMKYLDPLECQYYFKINSLLGYICYMYLGDYGNAIEYGKKVEKFAKNIGEEGERQSFHFFEEFYDTTKQKYFRIVKSRMSLREVYQYIAVSYRELSQRERANQYWEELRMQ